jgi:N-acetylmuramoyl-L-alanine amidase
MMFVRLRSWKIYISLTLIYLLFLLPGEINPAHYIVNTAPIIGKPVIVIDPGHGGIDSGTHYRGILEKNINLEIGLKLKEIIEKNSKSEVIMTRTKDTALDHRNNYSSSRHRRDLRARVDIINQGKADIFISLHVDARGNEMMAGPMVLYHSRQPQNKVLAEIIQNHLNEINHPEANFPAHGIKRRRDLYILKAKNTPGIIIEAGFITNPKDRRLLQNDSYQWALVEAIYQGIEEYFSGFKFLI